MKTIKILILLIALANTHLCVSQTIGFKGQLPMWTTINPDVPFQLQSGIRYIPELSFNKQIQKSISFDGEISLNTYVTGLFANDTLQLDEKFKPYRLWLRLSGNQFEVRAGLQKINFGSAYIIRPLMWFDQIDPKDPLQLTDGVYGILGRYYFLNNANIWVWGLIGNDKPKGLEFFPSLKQIPELGGRIQLPLFTGEIAATYHHRQFDTRNTYLDTVLIKNTFPENRFAIDIRMDNIIGFWVESALVYQNFEAFEKYNKTLNLGMDYTFNIGNGLGLMTEYFVLDYADEFKLTNNATSFFASSLNYPLNIFSSLSLMGFYYPKENALGSFLNWSFTFDKWNYYVMTFYIPSEMQLPGMNDIANLYNGFGFQLMAVFNH